VQPFVDAHRALILRHARSYVKALGEKIAAEDVAREIELELTQLGVTTGLQPSAIEAPDAYVRSLVKHASGRAGARSSSSSPRATTSTRSRAISPRSTPISRRRLPPRPPRPSRPAARSTP
jgi:hypothetical protein